jgi:phosphoglycolate phosphatase
MIERALAAEDLAPTDVELDRMYDTFIAHYSAHIADRSRPFPHLETALRQLAEAGHRLAVCTNKLEWLSVRLLDALHLTRHFTAICGADTFGMQKPDPQMLRLTVERAGGVIARTIMIGDSVTDVRTSRAASVPVIAVDFGYSDVPIATLEPDRIIGSFAELPAIVSDIEAGLAAAVRL